MDNLCDLLQERLQGMPERVIYRYWQEGAITDELTFASLDKRARAAAAHLQAHTPPGSRVIIALPHSLDAIVAFFACLYSGMVAVPIPLPPANRLETIKRFLQDAQSQTIVTVSPVSSPLKAEAEAAGLGSLHWVDMDKVDPASAASCKRADISSSTPAILMYTSGSTNYPRGILANHGSILASIRASMAPVRSIPEINAVFWSPFYHVIGLITPLHVLGYTGTHLFFAPMAFIQKPITWMRLISEYRANLSCGPTFSYRLCVESVKPEEREGLDLSEWKIAMSGGEPIRLEVVRQFARAYEPYGFSIKTFTPAYGLSETLAGTHAELHQGPRVVWAKDDALEQRKLVETDEQVPAARPFVSVGKPLPGYEMRIVNPDTRQPCTAQEIGEIWVASRALAQGYWNKPQETEETFHARLASGEGPYFRTGDLGFMKDGEVYVCGRLKDVIILHGRNLSAIDFELAAGGAHPSLMPGAAAAFGITVEGEEQAVLMQETRLGQEQVDVDEVADQIRRTVSEKMNVPLHTVVLLKPGSLPRSPSGKIQRFRCRMQYLDSMTEEEE